MVQCMRLAKEQLAERRERYFRLVLNGMSSSEACRRVGVSKRTGKVWRNGRRRSSGRNELPLLPYVVMENSNTLKCEGRNNYVRRAGERYLSLEDRLEIADLVRQGLSVREIARRLSKRGRVRSASTVSRELKRCDDVECSEEAREQSGGSRGRPGAVADGQRNGLSYNPFLAHQLFVKSLARPRQRKLEREDEKSVELRDYVKDKLALCWSPEQISQRLVKDFPYTEHMRISHEAIYQSIYVQSKGQLKREIESSLRTGRVVRKPRSGRRPSGRQFRDPMVNVSERPAEAEDRAVPGHWEGDLITGAKNGSAIGTLVERTSRFTLLLHLPGNHEAATVRDAIIDEMKGLPELLRRSLTWDQGSEMALHSKISQQLDLNVFFCDPHSPWQRGSNENTNGLLRQYFPKSTDLSVHSPDRLKFVAAELNGRPRKTLGWLTPAERLAQILSETDEQYDSIEIDKA